MATLMEGREYGLASNALSEENKTVVHFKLTDTALKTLENYSRLKSGRATIKFHGTTGIIKIPSFGNQPERIFQISLSALPGDPNGSFDCIQQNSNSLSSFGTMQYRVSVNATDDVFDRTRAKMTMAEEENKKVCTKEIKPSGRHISKKVKKVLPPGSLKIPPPVSKSSSVTKSASTISGSSRHSFGGSSSLPTTTSSLVSSSMISPSVPALGLSRHSPTPNSTSSVTKAPSINTNNQSRVLTSSTTKQSSGAINMPYRDRIIHLLALKPYKKPELILRLQKDGIREKDKNSLGTVLQQVATMNRDNSYTLAKGAWADVRLDWPFYTEQDKVLLKKNLQLESRAAPTSPAVSPASNPESPGNSQKRQADETDDNASNPSKKKRIAHTDRRQVEERPVSVRPTLIQQSSPTANRENFEGTNEENDTERPDFISKFTAIEDSEQRQHYKQEFNREYVEYRELHKEVDEVARKFQKLRSQINETEEGTKDFEVLKKQVLEEYEAQKSDPKFMEKKQRMDYLHQKLGHIKRLIHEYDQQIHAIPCS